MKREFLQNKLANKVVQNEPAEFYRRPAATALQMTALYSPAHRDFFSTDGSNTVNEDSWTMIKIVREIHNQTKRIYKKTKSQQKVGDRGVRS